MFVLELEIFALSFLTLLPICEILLAGGLIGGEHGEVSGLLVVKQGGVRISLVRIFHLSIDTNTNDK